MPLLDVRDGSRIHYEATGEGPPVLLIQGVGIAGCGWRPQIEGLRAQHRVATYDNRGLGQSVPRIGELSIERMADDGLELMDALGFARAHVVGHSMGGLIAQELALRAQDRVRSLALLCTFSRGRDATAITAKMLWYGLRTNVGTRRMRRRAFLEMVAPRSLLAGDRDRACDELSEVFGRDLADAPSIAFAQLSAVGRHDTTPRLAALAHVPTLVVSASEDPIAPPRAGRRIAEALPSARFVEFAGASHAVVVHRAAEINAALLAHFADADRAAARPDPRAGTGA